MISYNGQNYCHLQLFTLIQFKIFKLICSNCHSATDAQIILIYCIFEFCYYIRQFIYTYPQFDTLAARVHSIKMYIFSGWQLIDKS